MQTRFVRTTAGQDEIRSRTLGLPRHQRNLLLVISPDKPAGFWLSQVKGCEADDLRQLVEAGLLAPAPSPAPAPAAAAPSGDASAPLDLARLRQRLRESSYSRLYDALNAHGRETLGLVASYRFALELERCAGAPELQALAMDYLDRIADHHGLASVRRLSELL
ncbi:hypothetical protein KAK07_09385 [Ideonella sp. 4Y16]|uniref:Uncharacterized protein n=1 Tax=Ideonella alba TaxID=2824118 RepID=A0A941BHQ7_9BURK|nr:hypothetical protein [Ideonella alba]MBQ0933407.1 hypothetical protein [Ideonella alba]MBQ0943548.1 hypothetical protein [Ideonella alba]